MSHDEFIALVSLLVDGQPSEEQLAQLEQHLREHPDDRQYLVDHLFLDSMLTDEIGKESVAALVDMVAANEPAVLAPLAKWRRQVFWAWGAVGAAAVVLLAVGAILYSLRDGAVEHAKKPTDPIPPVLAQVLETDGLEFVDAKGEAKAAMAGDEVKPGQTMRTNGEDGYAVIKSNGSARIEMIGDTMAHLVEEPAADGGKRFFLSQGVLRVEDATKATSKITISTPHASIFADGTFLCSTTAEATYVEVEAGRIKLVRQADGHEVNVSVGESIVAAADIKPMAAKTSALTLTTPLFTLKKAIAGKLAFSRDAATLTTFDFRTARIWEMKTGQLKATQELPLAEFRHGILSQDARFVVGASKGSLIHLFDAFFNKQILSVPAGGKEIHALALSEDGSLVATSETPEFRRGLIRFFDGVTGAPGRTARLQAQPIKALAFSADQTLLAAGSQKGTVYLVPTSIEKDPIAFPELAHGVTAVTFSPDGRQLAAVSSGGFVVVWDVATRTEIHRFQATGRSFMSVSYSAGGRFLAAGTGDGMIKLWNTESGAEQLTLKAHSGGIRAIAFAPDGGLLASASGRQAFVWRLPDDAVDPIK